MEHDLGKWDHKGLNRYPQGGSGSKSEVLGKRKNTKTQKLVEPFLNGK